MAKSLEQIKASLKLKTAPKEGALTLRVGKRKVVLPFEVRLLECDNYLFVHIPPAAEILRSGDESFAVVEDVKAAEAAANEFKKSRRRRRVGSRTTADVPAELKEALSKVPAGFKLVYGPDGSPRLAKSRARRKK
ncbi:MAG: hypothetical protein JNM28_04980 [Armatimonadetes bacterium]|nr:hypothetical protein [Armatimonadota bacterium]MBS1712469.1 hypothetical protein [Armatimonadota bacterium]MBX3109222.1 hypothetical protein [Fimbriimonadaceae bacterium]